MLYLNHPPRAYRAYSTKNALVTGVNRPESHTEVCMNKDEIKGTVKDVAGKTQQKVGELTGSEEQQVKGLKNQAEGKIQKGVGHVKDALDDAKKD
jgi:uncharacterized protein YjbJ (UPF0337 family)